MQKYANTTRKASFSHTFTGQDRNQATPYVSSDSPFSRCWSPISTVEVPETERTFLRHIHTETLSSSHTSYTTADYTKISHLDSFFCLQLWPKAQFKKYLYIHINTNWKSRLSTPPQNLYAVLDRSLLFTFWALTAESIDVGWAGTSILAWLLDAMINLWLA